MNRKHTTICRKTTLTNPVTDYQKLVAAYVNEYESRLLTHEDPPPDPGQYVRRFQGPEEARADLRLQLNLITLMVAGTRKGMIDWDALVAAAQATEKGQKKTRAQRARVEKSGKAQEEAHESNARTTAERA
ncbi:MAG: hypothetical protein KBE65_15920 [Phycisphaerae bacterium]|nr:hypothetical protein [Phycisphaerae bacterium]